MLQPLVRRTWAPSGKRPILYCWEKRDRLSVIGGLTLSARYRRIGLYFAIHSQNVRTDEVEAFIRQVNRQVRRPLIVVMNRLSAHLSAAKRLAGDDRFVIEWLPAYAPDTNPMEPGWSQTKYTDLANYAPGDLLDLEIMAERSLNDTRNKQDLLRSFFHAAGLKV